ncbi:bifunctional helix-turn-helix transcriptional regulator/GNAT family N-acetyltransferase [uncultured Muribaculum sp.]|uniref:bifunctional helix-turn-helix transcriptional regulator/GNAT family N-acetyltransferase n=1 Tax=uncultured Muribaculum sp. TaxID=1918613 RepID=UPI0025980B03|nr:bifunctional helix-turn-helix transcriptional regulator/GNAT family N-acetyltransferase [uncultured Muribaculum sp.]
MDFFERTGKMAIGSRLRVLTETMTRDAASIYGLYGVEIKPKWFPVFYSLTDEQPKSVTAIAKEIGQSHPSVSTIVKEMIAAELIVEIDDKADRRCTLITLTEYGKSLSQELIAQLRDVERAVEQISAECDNDLWAAIADWEKALRRKSILERVREIKESREHSEVEIIEYQPQYKKAFYELNRKWIELYWELEPHDIEVLENPEKHILEKGGQIFVALYNGFPVGVCALCPMPEESVYDFELAKLAVNNSIRRKGIGHRLCDAVINRARELGGKTLFLESNTRLKPAIALYRKLGFKELPEYHPAYARGDIQMELSL